MDLKIIRIEGPMNVKVIKAEIPEVPDGGEAFHFIRALKKVSKKRTSPPDQASSETSG